MWHFKEVPGSETELSADLVLLALGFTGPEKNGLLEQLGVDLTERGNVANTNWRTNVDGVYCQRTKLFDPPIGHYF